MKIKIFLLSLLSAVALTVTAQGLSMKAIVIYKTDGSRDTILWQNAWGNSYETAFYGKENPVDDDYVTLYFSISEDYQMTYRSSLTDEGRNAPYSTYGTIISTEHIESYGNLTTPTDLFFVNQLWGWTQKSDSRIPIGNDTYNYVINPSNVKKKFNFTPGQTFYVRAAYVLDGKTYWSTEIEARAPKTRSLMHELVYPSYQAYCDSVLFLSNAESIINSNIELFGSASESKQKLYTESLKKVMSRKSFDDVKAIVTKTDECDDGTLYLIDDIPASLANEAIEMMKEELSQPFYVQATPDNIYTGAPSATEFGTDKCIPTIVVADEKWGIRDNQYLTTAPTSPVTKPKLAILIDHLLMPNSTYDVTLTIAPNTQNEADTCNTYFTVYIADENEDGTMPLLSKSTAYGSDLVISNKPAFIAKPQELTTITMQYVPKVFTETHVLQLEHRYSFLSAANRARYGQQFRVVGIEVKPHNEAGAKE